MIAEDQEQHVQQRMSTTLFC